MNGNNSLVRAVLPLVVLAVGLLISMAANAQSSSDEPSAKRSQLEEIVVTAEKRTENLQTTALSATVLTGDMLSDKGITNLYQIQYAAPSVTIASQASANEFNIRGVGKSQVDIDVPNGVMIYRDGAPTLTGYFQNEPYFDLKSVEVLRGPQGTFVGRSAAGGAVFINTNDPDPTHFYGSLQGGGGNFSEKEFTGIVNIPISDKLAVRADYYHLDSGNFYDKIYGNYTGHPGTRDLNSFRGNLLWEPNSQFSALIKVDYNDLDFGGNVVSSPGYPLFTVEQNGDLAYHDKNTRVVGTLKYTFENGTSIKSLTAYQNLDSVNNLDLNGSVPAFYQFKSKFNVQVVSQELDLISPDTQRLRWIGGFLYFKQDVDVPPWQDNGFTFTGGPFAADYPWLTSPWKQHQDEWSVFGHLSYDLTDTVSLDGGVRYNNYNTDQFTDWTFGDGTFPPTLQFTPPGTQKLHENSVDGQVSLNWKVNDAHFLYALFSRGHIVGGINIFPPFREYQEEEVFNYEGGWKASWMDDSVRTQATIYYQAFNHFQVNYEQLAAFGAPGQDNRNAPGHSSIYGFEFSMQGHINDWHPDFAFAYMHSDIGVFRNVIDPFTLQNIDLSHERTPYSPKFTVSGGLSYDFHLTGMASGFTLTPRMDISYVSQTQSKLWPESLVTMKARTLANAQVVLDAPNDKWSLTFWMTNAFDKRYVAGIQNLASLYYAGRPREFGARVKYNF